MNRPFQRPNITGMSRHQRYLLQARLHKDLLTRLQQQLGTGLVPRGKEWKTVDEQLIRVFGDAIGSKDSKRLLGDAVPHVIKAMPTLAEEVAELATSKPELIKTYWLPRLLELVAFVEYGVKTERVTERYIDLLLANKSQSVRGLIAAVHKREGSTSKSRSAKRGSAQSEAGVTIVEVHKKLAKFSTYAIEDFHAYLRKAFHNNLLKAVHHDDVSLPASDKEKTEWARKIARRKKQSLDELQESDGKSVDAALKRISPPSAEDALIRSGKDILTLIPEGRLRKVAILRFLEDLTQAEVGEKLDVTEKTIRTDEAKIKKLVRAKLIR